jgi:hypothetical protein
MGTRWQQQLGNTSQFAIMIGFEDDPDEGAGAAREMAASWGAFQIWVRGQNLCAHMEEGETVTSVHWYLLPMLEWIAEHWQPLLHEEKLPVKNAADAASDALYHTAFPPITLERDAADAWETRWYAWRSRHALEACREGGLFPDVVLRRFRDRVEVSWGEARLAGAPQGFQLAAVGRGDARAGACRAGGGLIATAVPRCGSFGPGLGRASPTGSERWRRPPETSGKTTDRDGARPLGRPWGTRY